MFKLPAVLQKFFHHSSRSEYVSVNEDPVERAGLLRDDVARSIEASGSDRYTDPDRASIAARFFNFRSVAPFVLGGSIAGGVLGPTAVAIIDLCAPWWVYAVASGVGVVGGGVFAGSGPVALNLCQTVAANSV